MYGFQGWGSCPGARPRESDPCPGNVQKAVEPCHCHSVHEPPLCRPPPVFRIRAPSFNLTLDAEYLSFKDPAPLALRIFKRLFLKLSLQNNSQLLHYLLYEQHVFCCDKN